MLRLLGALSVFCALSWCGFQRALWYRQRVECIAAWQNALREGERQLCDLGIQTPEWLGWMREQKLLSAFAEQCQIGLERSDSLSAAWRAALIQAEFPLEKDELSVLMSVGGVVGRYDNAGQRAALRSAQDRLELYARRAGEEKQRMGKMWPVLGLSAGALAVVLLY